MKLIKNIDNTNNEVFITLSLVDMLNRYFKSEQYKNVINSPKYMTFGCSRSGKTSYSAGHYRNKFYTFKNLYIQEIINKRKSLVNEWHYEPRTETNEEFVLVSFNVNGQIFRFHQKKKEISNLPDNMMTDCRPYSHDDDDEEYLGTKVDYECSDSKLMRTCYEYLLKMTEPTIRPKSNKSKKKQK